jgi:hypothetical protein
MSSPKRAAKLSKPVKTAAAKTARKAGAKPRRHAAPARAAAKPVIAVADGATAEAKRVAATLSRSIVDGKLDLVAADALQALIASACRVYAARREAGEDIAPVGKNAVSATDVMVTASGLLRAVDLAVFELGMWQNWTGR